jgi:hypothetical protein
MRFRCIAALVLSIAALVAWSPTVAAPPQSRTQSFHLDVPCARAFPMFTPLGERAWAPGWEPELLSGNEDRGSVFRTRAHGVETLWVVTDYRPAEGRVSYARLKQGSNFGIVDVECRGAAGGSEVTVSYTLTGVTPEGAASVREFLDAAHYDAFIGEWRDAIGSALSKPPEPPAAAGG